MAKGESEKETRKKRINQKLKALGWGFVPDGKPTPKGWYWRDEFETKDWPADYALYVDCIERELLTWRRLRFPGVAVGNLVVGEAEPVLDRIEV